MIQIQTPSRQLIVTLESEDLTQWMIVAREMLMNVLLEQCMLLAHLWCSQLMSTGRDFWMFFSPHTHLPPDMLYLLICWILSSTECKQKSSKPLTKQIAFQSWWNVRCWAQTRNSYCPTCFPAAPSRGNCTGQINGEAPRVLHKANTHSSTHAGPKIWENLTLCWRDQQCLHCHNCHVSPSGSW